MKKGFSQDDDDGDGETMLKRANEPISSPPSSFLPPLSSLLSLTKLILCATEVLQNVLSTPSTAN